MTFLANSLLSGPRSRKDSSGDPDDCVPLVGGASLIDEKSAVSFRLEPGRGFDKVNITLKAGECMLVYQIPER